MRTGDHTHPHSNELTKPPANYYYYYTHLPILESWPALTAPERSGGQRVAPHARSQRALWSVDRWCVQTLPASLRRALPPDLYRTERPSLHAKRTDQTKPTHHTHPNGYRDEESLRMPKPLPASQHSTLHALGIDLFIFGYRRQFALSAHDFNVVEV